ncbi:MAG: hypothetical protein FJ121_10990 [Deltaproteobacteria bacterium]|nr:hypothetical protein [Deltaproteobacteria bacterium]
MNEQKEKLKDREIKYLDFLLADFNALKSEIARRSNLQRVVLALYGGAFASIFYKIRNEESSSISIDILWIVAFLTLLFYFREHLEIKRLSTLIKDRIALPASELLNVEQHSILTSETNPSVEGIDKITRPYNNIFLWIGFFFLPILISIKFINMHWIYLLIIDTNVYQLIGMVSACATIFMLKKHAWPLFQISPD